MYTTIVLAKISGLMCLAIGLSVLNKKSMAVIIDELLNSKNRALFWFVGFVAALIGAVTLSFYNTWSFHWPVLITILGWAALLKGVIIMLFPDSLLSYYKKLKINGIVMFGGVVALIFGIILLYKSFSV